MMRLFKILGFTLTGIVIVFLFNYLFLERLIIPDPCYCYYHSHDTTKLFDLFYELTSSEGYHPTPTKLNLILTVIIGAMTGLLIGQKLIIKKQD